MLITPKVSFSHSTAMASNNTIPYNMGFTWNGLNFVVKIPAGADYSKLIDANGNLEMWRIVQKYGIAGAAMRVK